MAKRLESILDIVYIHGFSFKRGTDLSVGLKMLKKIGKLTKNNKVD